MSVLKNKRAVSSTQFIQTAWDLNTHIKFYCTGKKFGTGNAQNRIKNGDRIFWEDLNHVRNLGFSILQNVLRANTQNPESPEEAPDRRRLLHYVLADITALDMLIQGLFLKFVKIIVVDENGATKDITTALGMDKALSLIYESGAEKDKIKIKVVPNVFFYKEAARLMSEETKLIKAVIASDKKRLSR